MFCTNCGANVPDHTKFCSECGARIQPKAAAPDMQGMQPPAGSMPFNQPKKKKPWKPILAVVLVIALICGGMVGYSYYCQKKEYRSNDGRYSLSPGSASFSVSGGGTSTTARGQCVISPYCSITITCYYMTKPINGENITINLKVPENMFKTGQVIRQTDLSGSTTLTVTVGNTKVITVYDYTALQDMKITLESIDRSGIRLPGESSAFLPFGASCVRFSITFIYGGVTYTVDGFGADIL